MIVRTANEDFPFCSDRCRKIDLGKWAMGVYKITSPILDPDVMNLSATDVDQLASTLQHRITQDKLFLT